MDKSLKKYLGAFKNLEKIAEGVKNNIFKKEHVEAVFKDRLSICEKCLHYDLEGKGCMAPGTQPCCGDCGCSLDFKLRSLSSECSKGHWGAKVSEETEELITKQIEKDEHTN